MVSYPTDDTRSLSHASTSRRAPSVASSSGSTVRRHHHHRHGRSHAGGSTSRAVSNEFPIFTHTGDVEIVIAPNPRLNRRRDSGRGSVDESRERTYLLHRLILAQCSGFFEAGTSEEWSREGSQAGAGASSQRARYQTEQEGHPRKRWRYELDWGRGDDEVPMLVNRHQDPSSSIFGGETDSRHARPPPTRPKPQPPPSGFFRSMANFSALNISSHSRSSSGSTAPTDPLEPSELLLQAYDNLFRTFYNYPPALDAVNIAHAYVECKALLQIADMYDALDVVGPRVDHHLLRFGARLWKQIAKYPPSYLKLGYLARSRAIFAEAVIHVVGSWPACAQQLGYTGPYAPRGPSSALPAPGVTQLPDAVFELIEDKVDDLEDLKSKVETKLWRLTLTTSRGERVNPANGWLDWLAMSLFRQWLAENTTPPPTSILKDSSIGRSVLSASSAALAAQPSSSHLNSSSSPRHPLTFNTGRVFRLLGSGGQSYLPHAELKAFLKLHPENYDREKLKRFERRVEEMKNLARDVVKPLMRNFLEIDVVGAGERERDGVVVGYLTCSRVGEGEYPWEE
ncbi:hypothetical protein NA57DRAFT_38177 [Rhizodiscina lignyota]|uniref:Uncharacterized protein n=1 Tax=Rhizodiscina lignyota TaxID=1504668 RepID=A0A9P4ICL4_9PEZI|nr:hypothetical protein NA57DRAFT_38177 [Rhizodiscina lignyota]